MIPDYQSIMLPLLELAQDGETHELQSATQFIAQTFGVTDDERRQLLPSDTSTVFRNRIGWAITHLTKANLLERPRRASIRITERGRQVLGQGHAEISVKLLDQYEEYASWRQPVRPRPGPADLPEPEPEPPEGTPQESLDAAYSVLRRNLATDLLENVMACPPAFFEKLVVDLLVAMGYGGTREEAGRVIGGPGDEGIDGVINQDPLGLDVVYLQAKRWSSNVGTPEIQRFVGALQLKGAQKGVFITTSGFTAAASSALPANIKVILVDGPRLAGLMIDHGIGVTTQNRYEVKSINSDYFLED